MQFLIYDDIQTEYELVKMLDDKEFVKAIFRLLRKKDPCMPMCLSFYFYIIYPLIKSLKY